MTQRTFPGLEELMGPINEAPDLDYGEFMRTTTPQERVEAIVMKMRHNLGTLTFTNPIIDWLVEAAGPQGYECVPLDWIRELRQSKEAATQPKKEGIYVR